MSIKHLSRTPRIIKTLADEGAFIKALYNELTVVKTTINTIISGLEDDKWRAATLLNSWVSYGSGYAPAGYMLDAQGFVHLRGAVKSGNGTIFNLPSGYQPAYMTAAVGMSAGNTPCNISMAMDGSVTVEGQSNSFVALDGISFKAAT